MAMREIPVTPSKQFLLQVSLDGQDVELSFRWNLTGQYWTYNLTGQSLTDEITGAAVVNGINLLRPYAIRELGELWCIDGTDLGEDPDFDNFGSRWSLIYVEKGTVI
jgi:hypothetical protein